MFKPISDFFESFWENSLSIDDKGFPHFPEHDFENKTWKWHKSRSAQNTSEGLSKYFLSHGSWCREIEGARTRLCHHQVMDGIDLVVERNPRVVLTPTSNGPSTSKLRGQEQFLQRPTHRRNDQTRPNPYGTNSCIGSRLSC